MILRHSSTSPSGPLPSPRLTKRTRACMHSYNTNMLPDLHGRACTHVQGLAHRGTRASLHVSAHAYTHPQVSKCAHTCNLSQLPASTTLHICKQTHTHTHKVTRMQTNPGVPLHCPQARAHRLYTAFQTDLLKCMRSHTHAHTHARRHANTLLIYLFQETKVKVLVSSQ